MGRGASHKVSMSLSVLFFRALQTRSLELCMQLYSINVTFRGCPLYDKTKVKSGHPLKITVYLLVCTRRLNSIDKNSCNQRRFLFSRIMARRPYWINFTRIRNAGRTPLNHSHLCPASTLKRSVVKRRPQSAARSMSGVFTAAST